ncbi:hypothetical protein F5144DRAFT_583022 [Chaetomium tenue]|uniref:Uncharacterized protein n=1 Tax=Chaetomium tenue TaxID=1854479 RepID=A0ACB7NY37_9PEZI|nr:hypothetical protein F5144DRAFT_583022 [Chaetomium globosum]
MVERQEELLSAVRRHGSQWDADRGAMDAVFDRIKEVSRMREDAETARFERMDEERERKVEELDDKVDELEKKIDDLKDQRDEDAHRFRQMRNLLVALSDGDITMKEVCRDFCWRGLMIWFNANTFFHSWEIVSGPSTCMIEDGAGRTMNFQTCHLVAFGC